jgi:hypothetical protein
MSSEEEPLFMDGYDDCIAGMVRRFGMDIPIVCYDYKKVIDKLMGDGMTHEEAVEFFEFNQIGAWVGEGTPCFIDTDDLELQDALERRKENGQS